MPSRPQPHRQADGPADKKQEGVGDAAADLAPASHVSKNPEDHGDAEYPDGKENEWANQIAHAPPSVPER